MRGQVALSCAKMLNFDFLSMARCWYTTPVAAAEREYIATKTSPDLSGRFVLAQDVVNVQLIAC